MRGHPRGHLFVISGPSGVGKGSVIRALLDRADGLWLSVSCTTRPPREGDQEGETYKFVSLSRFEEMRERGEFLECAEVYGNWYGTPKAEVERRLERGEDVVLEIDVQGALQVKERLPEAITIFIEPPSMAELERRLRGRATDSEEAIKKRLAKARWELEQKGSFDYVVVNDNLNSAVEEVLRIVGSSREARCV